VTDFMREIRKNSLGTTWLSFMSTSVESAVGEAAKWLGYDQLKP